MRRFKQLQIIIYILFVTGLMMGASGFATENKVDINTATIEELTSLKYVGQAIAQRIIDYREQIQGFKSVEMIKEVKGFGEKAWAANKDRIIITPYKMN